MDTLLMTHAEAAELLEVSDRTFYRLVQRGFVRRHTLPGMTYGKYYRADVAKFREAALANTREPERSAREFLEKFEQQKQKAGKS